MYPAPTLPCMLNQPLPCPAPQAAGCRCSRDAPAGLESCWYTVLSTHTISCAWNTQLGLQAHLKRGVGDPTHTPNRKRGCVFCTRLCVLSNPTVLTRKQWWLNTLWEVIDNYSCCHSSPPDPLLLSSCSSVLQWLFHELTIQCSPAGKQCDQAGQHTLVVHISIIKKFSRSFCNSGMEERHTPIFHF